jgi:hypothetical protein
MGEWPRLGGDGEEREWEFVRACLLFLLVSALIFPPALAGWRRGGRWWLAAVPALRWGRKRSGEAERQRAAVLRKEIAVDWLGTFGLGLVR